MAKLDLNKIQPEQPEEEIREMASKEADELFAKSTPRYVAFLDILGFKYMVERMSAEKLRHRYLNVLEKPPKEIYKEETKLSFYVFSDSIIVYSVDDSLESAIQIADYCTYLFINAFSCEVLIKGAIAHGEFTADKTNNIYFGIPLVEAFQLEEEMKVASVILHHTAERSFKEHKSDELDKLTLEVETPMKGYKVKHQNLHWHSDFLDPEDLNFFTKALFTQASGGARLYIENTESLIKKMKEIKLGKQV